MCEIMDDSKVTVRVVDDKTFGAIAIGDTIKMKNEAELIAEFGMTEDGVAEFRTHRENEDGELAKPYYAWSTNDKMDFLFGKEIEVTGDILNDIISHNSYNSIEMFTVTEGDKTFYISKAFVKEIIKATVEERKEIPNIINRKSKKIIEEMKSKVDVKRLQKLIAVASSNHGTKVFPTMEIVDKYLDEWAKAKYDLYVMFNHELTINKEIQLEMSESEMSTLIGELSLKFPKYLYWLDRYNAKMWMANEIKSASFERGYFPFAQDGMKLTKFFTQAFEDDKFDIEASKVLQNKFVTGVITVSIDPYDYITMSVNKHKWDSCHKATGGMYATGGISYMLDETTMIAFRHSGKEYEYNLNGFKFNGNSKQQRQCVYFDKETLSIIFGREYPNKNAEMAKEIRMLLEDHISKKYDLDGVWKVRNSYEGEYKDASKAHYSDVKNGFDYKFAQLKNYNLKQPSFVVGAKWICPSCGKKKTNYHNNVNCCK